MALPSGPRALSSLAFYRRERRRLKQNEEAFVTAGLEPSPWRILDIAVNAGGAGYNVGDEFLISGGTFSVQGRGYVVAEVGNVVTEVAVQLAGAYTVTPGVGAATVAQTGTGNDLLTVDVTLSALHDFGSQAAGVGSPNNLTLPANARFAVSHSVGLSPEDFSLSTLGPPELGHDNAETTGAGGIQEIRHYYRKDQVIHVFRRAGSLAGTLSLYLLGPNNTRTLIATATWT
jgi:hypothetical protein